MTFHNIGNILYQMRRNPVAGRSFTIVDGDENPLVKLGYHEASSGLLLPNSNLVLPKEAGYGIKVDIDNPAYTWRDIIGKVQPKGTGAGFPARSVYNGGTLADYAFAVNDLVDFVFHIPHDWVPGTDLYFHVHWSHNGTTSISGNAQFTIYHSYAKGHNQAEFSAEKNVVLTYDTTDLATTPQYRHRIDEILFSTSGGSATLMDTDDIEVDGLIIATLKLTGLPTIGGGGKLFIHTCDVHYLSSNIGTVNKAPDFYVPA